MKNLTISDQYFQRFNCQKKNCNCAVFNQTAQLQISKRCLLFLGSHGIMLKIILIEQFLSFPQPLRDDIGPGKKANDQRKMLTFTMLVKPKTQIATYKTAESHEANIPLVKF